MIQRKQTNTLKNADSVKSNGSNSLQSIKISQIESEKGVIQTTSLLKIKSKSYVLKDKLGSGGFSQVFRIEYRSSKDIEIYAFKQFPNLELSVQEANSISEEIGTLSG